jgi:hypothetical protein
MQNFFHLIETVKLTARDMKCTVVFLSANFIGDCLLPLCGETISMAVVPLFEIVFLIITGNQYSVCEAMPCFLALVRELNMYGKKEITENKKDRNFENILMGTRDG